MDILALLFPREKKFYRMIETQVRHVGEGVEHFHLLITKFNTLSLASRKKQVQAITAAERHDDILYTQMVHALKSTFITPMDREDIHQLVVTFDDIIDLIELITLKISAYETNRMDKHLIEQTKIFKLAFELNEKLILSIRRESEVEKYCQEIRQLEQAGDAIYMQALSKLFSDSLKPASIIKLQDLYASLEQLIERTHESALIIENLVVKYS